MKRSFFDTGFAVHAGIAQQLTRLMKYMLENRHTIFDREDLERLCMPIRAILKTPLAECFDRMLSGGTLSNFCAFYVPDKSTGVPEILSTPSITIDMKQASNASIVSTLPEVRDRILVNLTSTLKRDRMTGGFSVSAVDAFYHLFVRGQFVVGYNDQDTWLNTYLADYVVKTYSMILAGLISRYYNLSFPEQMRVAGVFALHYSQLLSGEDSDNEMPPLFMHCTFLGNRAELMAMAKEYSYKSAAGLNAESCCELIAGMGIDKMANFNIQSLIAMTNSLGPDLITSQISLEYPPYWVFMLVAALSGAKIPLIYQLNQHKLNNEGRSRWVTQLLNQRSIFDYTRF